MRSASTAEIGAPAEHQLERPALADQPRQALRAGVAGKHAQIDFGLAEHRRVGRDPQRARHRQLAAAAERVTVDGGDDRLAEILDEVEDLLRGERMLPRRRPASGTASSLMSAPATNALSPAPVRTTTRTPSSACRSSDGPPQLVDRLRG